MLVEPSGQRLCLALRQQGDGSAYFEVDEDRPVTLPTLEGPVVNSQYPRRRGLFGEEALQQGKQGVGTDAKTQSRRQLGSCLSAESTPELSQSLGKTLGSSAIAYHHPGEPLGEDANPTLFGVAEEAPRAQFQTDGRAVPWQVGHFSLIAAVDPDSEVTTRWAPYVRSNGGDHQGNCLRSGNDRFEPQEAGVSIQRWRFHTPTDSRPCGCLLLSLHQIRGRTQK